MAFRQIPIDKQRFQAWRELLPTSFLAEVPLWQIARNVTVLDESEEVYEHAGGLVSRRPSKW
jgi:hypothetical protein